MESCVWMYVPLCANTPRIPSKDKLKAIVVIKVSLLYLAQVLKEIKLVLTIHLHLYIASSIKAVNDFPEQLTEVFSRKRSLKAIF